MSHELTILEPGGSERRVSLRAGLSLAQALFSAGVWRGMALCQGLGRCGHCRVRYVSQPPEPLALEVQLLSAQELAEGVRLACRHVSRSGDRIAPLAAGMVPGFRQVLRAEVSGPLRLAVDLGTTTLEWLAADGDGPVAEGRELNPQLGSGAEIMSRLAYAAAGGAEELRDVVLQRLQAIVSSLPTAVDGLCLAGNPAMTCLALGVPGQGLAVAPYSLPLAGGSWHDLGNGLPRCYVPPQLGPFVGGDLSAGLAWLLAQGTPFPFLLADMGTNGEFLLALDEANVLGASVPLGPALEGIGMRCGSVARPGVVVGYELTPAGLAPRWYEGTAGPGRSSPGLTGTAYLSLVALLRAVGLVGADGAFLSGQTPLAARLAAQLARDEAGQPLLRLDAGLYLAAADVEEVLKVKAACNVAMVRLLGAAGLRAGDLATVCLAGSFGRHVAVADLERLGFLPAGLAGRTRAVGNTSLAGAGLLLADKAWRARLELLAAGVRILDLTSAGDFQAEYLQRMVFSYVP